MLPELVERVAANIAANPDDEKYRRLKASSRVLQAALRVRHGREVVDWLGFRTRVLEMQEWLVVSDAALPELAARAELLLEGYRKALAAIEKEETTIKDKDAANAKYAATVRQRVAEQRLDALKRNNEAAAEKQHNSAK